MAGKFHTRKAHRRLVGGRAVRVSETTVFREDRSQQKLRSYSLSCPICGKPIIRIRMPNSGTAFFEGGEGLRQVKHPCFTVGRGLSRRRDEDTPDLFESLVRPEGE